MANELYPWSSLSGSIYRNRNSMDESYWFMVIKKDLANLSGLFYISSIIRKAIDSVSIISVNKPPRRAPKAA